MDMTGGTSSSLLDNSSSTHINIPLEMPELGSRNVSECGDNTSSNRSSRRNSHSNNNMNYTGYNFEDNNMNVNNNNNNNNGHYNVNNISNSNVFNSTTISNFNNTTSSNTNDNNGMKSSSQIAKDIWKSYDEAVRIQQVQVTTTTTNNDNDETETKVMNEIYIAQDFANQSFILPDLDDKIIPYAPIDKYVYHSMKRIIDWEQILGRQSAWSLKTCLVPIHTKGDGDCLCHSLSISMWGCHDRAGKMRQMLSHFLLDEDWLPRLYEIFIEGERNEDASLEIERSKQQLDSDWDMIVANACEEKAFLGRFHVFLFAQILRRPIIIYADKYLRDENNHEKIAPQHLRGIYLPTEVSPEKLNCTIPLALAYTANHFTALLMMDNRTDYLPLCDSKGIPLPIIYGYSNNNMNMNMNMNDNDIEMNHSHNLKEFGKICNKYMFYQTTPSENNIPSYPLCNIRDRKQIMIKDLHSLRHNFTKEIAKKLQEQVEFYLNATEKMEEFAESDKRKIQYAPEPWSATTSSQPVTQTAFSGGGGGGGLRRRNSSTSRQSSSSNSNNTNFMVNEIASDDDDDDKDPIFQSHLNRSDNVHNNNNENKDSNNNEKNSSVNNNNNSNDTSNDNNNNNNNNDINVEENDIDMNMEHSFEIVQHPSPQRNNEAKDIPVSSSSSQRNMDEVNTSTKASSPTRSTSNTTDYDRNLENKVSSYSPSSSIYKTLKLDPDVHTHRLSNSGSISSSGNNIYDSSTRHRDRDRDRDYLGRSISPAYGSTLYDDYSSPSTNSRRRQRKSFDEDVNSLIARSRPSSYYVTSPTSPSPNPSSSSQPSPSSLYSSSNYPSTSQYSNSSSRRSRDLFDLPPSSSYDTTYDYARRYTPNRR